MEINHRYADKTARFIKLMQNRCTTQLRLNIIYFPKYLRDANRTHQLDYVNLYLQYWDPELASGAQNWANQCPFAHNDAKDRKVGTYANIK